MRPARASAMSEETGVVLRLGIVELGGHREAGADAISCAAAGRPRPATTDTRGASVLGVLLPRDSKTRGDIGYGTLLRAGAQRSARRQRPRGERQADAAGWHTCGRDLHGGRYALRQATGGEQRRDPPRVRRQRDVRTVHHSRG